MYALQRLTNLEHALSQGERDLAEVKKRIYVCEDCQEGRKECFGGCGESGDDRQEQARNGDGASCSQICAGVNAVPREVSSRNVLEILIRTADSISKADVERRVKV